MRRKHQQWSPVLTTVVEQATRLELMDILHLIQKLEKAQVLDLAKELGIKTECPETRKFLAVLVSEGVEQMVRGSVTLEELRANPPTRDIPEPPATDVLDIRDRPRLRLPLGRTALTSR